MKRKLDSVAEEESYGDGDGVSWLRGRLLGKGGFGSVYLGQSKNPNSRIPDLMAIKSAEISASSSLQKEKEVFDDLGFHPSIVYCHGDETTTSKSGQTIYNILLEYATGGTLSDLIRRYGSTGMPEFCVRKYTKCLLQGIDFIHRQGYVHCDLKPDNVLLVSNPYDPGSFLPKIADFGLAKGCPKSSSSSKRMKCDPNCVGGTALYMAPESVIDGIQETPSDIWALGCIVYEMLTGKEVWNWKPDMTFDEILQMIREHCDEYPEIPAHIPEEAKGFLRRCLARTPISRLTAGMLLSHPFVSGIQEDDIEDCSNEERVEDDDHRIASRVSEDKSFTYEEEQEEEEDDEDHIELGSNSTFCEDKKFTDEEEEEDDIEMGSASRFSEDKSFTYEEEEEDDDDHIELGSNSTFCEDKKFTDEEEEEDDIEMGNALRFSEDKSFTYEEEQEEEEDDEDHIELGSNSTFCEVKKFTDEEEEEDDIEMGSASRFSEDKSFTYVEEDYSCGSRCRADDGVINRKRRGMFNENLLEFPKPGVIV